MLAVNGVGLTGNAVNSNGQTVIAPLTVTSTVVNGGNGLGSGNQRSSVKNLLVTFSGIATFDTGAFAVYNKTTAAAVGTVTASQDDSSGNSVVTLTWSGSQTLVCADGVTR